MKMTTVMIQNPHHTQGFKNLVLIQENVSDGNQWNVFVISPVEPQRDELTWVPIDKG